MNILVLGGSGVLSSDIVDKCLKDGHQVYIITRGTNPILKRDGLHSIVGNVRDLETLQFEIRKNDYDVVLDFLSYTREHLEYSYYHLANLCKHYIFISSACVFRRAPEDGVISENSIKPNPNLEYGIHKNECEEFLRSNYLKYKCKYTIVRPYITYGDIRIPVGVAPVARYHWTIIGRILSGKPFFIWDDGSNKCTLMHTQDFAYNFCQLLLNERAYNEDVNLVGDDCQSWMDVLTMIYKLCNQNVNIEKVSLNTLCQLLPRYAGYIRGDRSLNAVFDNSKLKSIISDYRQTISLKEGVNRTINYYRTNNYLNGIDYRYDGDIDRMLARVTKNRNIKFVDYLGNATVYDKMQYYSHRYFPLRMTVYSDRFIEKLKGI